MTLLEKIDLYLNEFQIDRTEIDRKSGESTEDYVKRLKLMDRLAKKKAKMATKLISRNNIIPK